MYVCMYVCMYMIALVFIFSLNAENENERELGMDENQFLLSCVYVCVIILEITIITLYEIIVISL